MNTTVSTNSKEKKKVTTKGASKQTALLELVHALDDAEVKMEDLEDERQTALQKLVHFLEASNPDKSARFTHPDTGADLIIMKRSGKFFVRKTPSGRLTDEEHERLLAVQKKAKKAKKRKRGQRGKDKYPRQARTR